MSNATIRNMKLHKKHNHTLPGINYWGEKGRVGLRVNFGDLKPGEKFPVDKLHAHKTRTTYFCVLVGSLKIEVEGKEVVVTNEQMLEVSPMEKYLTTGIGPDGCKWVVIGSHNEEDRVEF
jgi:mannose-6-phosphate isomerase-like protein (cupin superfamily)